jgi:hypothetical protein
MGEGATSKLVRLRAVCLGAVECERAVNSYIPW